MMADVPHCGGQPVDTLLGAPHQNTYYSVVGTVRNGSERLRKRLLLREERLSNAHGNAQGRGLCEANTGHAPRGVVC